MTSIATVNIYHNGDNGNILKTFHIRKFAVYVSLAFTSGQNVLFHFIGTNCVGPACVYAESLHTATCIYLSIGIVKNIAKESHVVKT